MAKSADRRAQSMKNFNVPMRFFSVPLAHTRKRYFLKVVLLAALTASCLLPPRLTHATNSETPDVVRGIFLGKILSYDKSRRTVVIGFIKPPHKRIEFQTDRRTRLFTHPPATEDTTAPSAILLPDRYIAGLYLRRGQLPVLASATVTEDYDVADKKLELYRKKLGKPKQNQ